MEERVKLLEELVDGQQKTIETLLELTTLLNNRIDNANKKIALVKQLTENNVDMIKSSNDTMMELFKLIEGE